MIPLCCKPGKSGRVNIIAVPHRSAKSNAGCMSLLPCFQNTPSCSPIHVGRFQPEYRSVSNDSAIESLCIMIQKLTDTFTESSFIFPLCGFTYTRNSTAQVRVLLQGRNLHLYYTGGVLLFQARSSQTHPLYYTKSTRIMDNCQFTVPCHDDSVHANHASIALRNASREFLRDSKRFIMKLPSSIIVFFNLFHLFI